MAYMIKITDSKAEELAEHAKKVLKHGKKLYECIEDLAEESSMGERGDYGARGGRYGNRISYREEDDWEDEDPYMGQRRGRSQTTGRYIRR